MPIPVRLTCGCEGDQQGPGVGGCVNVVVLRPCALHRSAGPRILEAVPDDRIEWRDEKTLQESVKWKMWRSNGPGRGW